MPRCLALCLLAWAALPVRADTGWRALARRLPHASAVVERQSIAMRVAADGSCRYRLRYRATVLKPDGISDLEDYSSTYYAPYSRVRVHRARVIGPDGRETLLGPGAVQDLPLPADDDFYVPNERLVLVHFPGLRVGSTVEVDLRSWRSDQAMDRAFALEERLQGSLPRLRQSVQVTVPASMPLAWNLLRGTARFTREAGAGRTTYRWRVDPQPALLDEPDMPADADVAPRLTLSTIRDWRQVSRWYARLCGDGRKPGPALVRFARGLVAGAPGREAAVRALLYWTRRHIRYVETTYSGAKAGWEPAGAERTLARRYGVCRDKAQLLVALLRAVGEEAHMVLINIGNAQDPAIPDPAFDHAIVALRRAGGGWRFLDPTAEHTRQDLAGADQGCRALVCTLDGETLQSTPVDPPAANRMDVTLDSALGADGALTARVLLVPTGLCERSLRADLSALPPERRTAYITQGVTDPFPGAELSGLSLPDPDDLTRPLRVRFTLRLPDQAVRAGRDLVFTSPGQGGLLGLVLAGLLPEAAEPERRYPLVLATTLASRVRERIALPAGCRVLSLPRPVALATPGARLERDCRTVPGALAYSEDLEFSARRFAGDAYQGLRRLLDAQGRLRDGRIILEMPK